MSCSVCVPVEAGFCRFLVAQSCFRKRGKQFRVKGRWAVISAPGTSAVSLGPSLPGRCLWEPGRGHTERVVPDPFFTVTARAFCPCHSELSGSVVFEAGPVPPCRVVATCVGLPISVVYPRLCTTAVKAATDACVARNTLVPVMRWRVKAEQLPSPPALARCCLTLTHFVSSFRNIVPWLKKYGTNPSNGEVGGCGGASVRSVSTLVSHAHACAHGAPSFPTSVLRAVCPPRARVWITVAPSCGGFGILCCYQRWPGACAVAPSLPALGLRFRPGSSWHVALEESKHSRILLVGVKGIRVPDPRKRWASHPFGQCSLRALWKPAPRC